MYIIGTDETPGGKHRQYRQWPNNLKNCSDDYVSKMLSMFGRKFSGRSLDQFMRKVTKSNVRRFVKPQGYTVSMYGSFGANI